MKHLVIILSIFLIGCGGESSTTKSNAQVSNSNQPAKPSKTVQSTPDGFASPEAIAETNTPVYGGPADFTLKMKGAQPGISDLIGYYAEQHFKIDTTVISADGTIHFKNPDGYPQGMYYISFANERYLQIILGEDQKFTLESEITDPDGKMKVTGSDENEAFFENLLFEQTTSPQFTELGTKLKQYQEGSADYEAVKKEQDALADQRDKHLEMMYKKYPNTLFSKFKQAGQNPKLREDVPKESVVYHYRQEFWDNVDFGDRRLLRTQVIFNKLKRYFDELTPQNQDSILNSATRLTDRLFMYPEYYKFISNWVVRTYEPTKTTLMDPEKVFVNMVQRYFTKDKAFWADSLNLFAIHQRAGEMANSLVGNIGPNVTSKDLQGNTHTLFDSKAEYLIVYMFAPSCEHCQEQTPKLVEYYNEWKGKGRDVYAIALDTDDAELGAYIKKTNMPFPCVWDSSNRSIYGKYYVDITPEVYVLNKERRIIGKNLKVFQIETVIARDKENKAKK